MKSCCECHYKQYRNKLTDLLKLTDPESNISKLKTTWGTIEDIIHKKIKQKFQSTFKLSDNFIISDGYAISENSNDFFVNICHTLMKRIPQTDISPNNYLGAWVTQTIFVKNVTPDELPWWNGPTCALA